MSSIASVRATPVSVRLKHPSLMSIGTPHSRITRTIVEVETDDGIVGLGETKAGYWTGVIEEHFGPKIVGMEPDDIDRIKARCLPPVFDYGTPMLLVEREAFGGLEVALWDNEARRRGLPLYGLLGGPARPEAPFVAYAFGMGASDPTSEADVPHLVAAHAQRLVEATGARIFEMKVGVNRLSCEIDTIRAVAEALPGVGVALDANMSMTVDEARLLMDAVSDLPIVNFEEPVAQLTDADLLGAEWRIPISTHCHDLDATRHLPNVQGIVVEIDTVGGISGVVDLARRARAVGKRVWLRSYPETGVMWAAMVHLGVALRELDRPGQCLIDIVEDDLVLGETWERRNGVVSPSDAPGLGVELDRPSVARGAEEYARLGPVRDFLP